MTHSGRNTGLQPEPSCKSWQNSFPPAQRSHQNSAPVLERINRQVMESTGVYWIPVCQILEQRGLEVKLVNACHVKNLPGRKSDVSDCPRLQQLHTFGLLSGSFRPKDEVTL